MILEQFSTILIEINTSSLNSKFFHYIFKCLQNSFFLFCIVLRLHPQICAASFTVTSSKITDKSDMPPVPVTVLNSPSIFQAFTAYCHLLRLSFLRYRSFCKTAFLHHIKTANTVFLFLFLLVFSLLRD